jgi:hypothetical protein
VGLWHTVRREVAGAWRSARYDVLRQIGVYRAAKLLTAETTELARADLIGYRHRQRSGVRSPQRVVATTGVALLVAGGAAGTYLAVAGGLAALTADPLAPTVAAPAPPAMSASRPASAGTAAKRAVPRRPAPQPALIQPRTATGPNPVTEVDQATVITTPSPGHEPEATPTSPPSEPPVSSSPSPSVTPSDTPSVRPPHHDGHRSQVWLLPAAQNPLPAAQTGAGR